jgi:hypothetical protein
VHSTDAADVGVSARPRGTIVFVRPACDQLIFVYTGWERGLQVDPIQFFNRTRLLERNVVIFQDRRRAFYQKGVSSSLDSFDALLRWQIEFRASLPHVRRVFCLGTSTGGFAALLAGHLLGVDHVWAFGPMTMLPPARTRRDLHEVAPARGDLQLALQVGNDKTTYGVYYNARYKRDVTAAMRLATCPRVTLCPQPGDDHNVVKTLLDLGKLETLLPAVC